eukprot:7566392-Pyramimonas_sp.AAC.1
MLLPTSRSDGAACGRPGNKFWQVCVPVRPRLQCTTCLFYPCSHWLNLNQWSWRTPRVSSPHFALDHSSRNDGA